MWLISIKLRWGLLPPRTITESVQHLTLKPVIISDEPQPRERDDCTSRSCPAGIIVAKLSAVPVQPLGLLVLIHTCDSRFSRLVPTGKTGIVLSLPRQNFHASTKTFQKCVFSINVFIQWSSSGLLLPWMWSSLKGTHPSNESLKCAAICWCIYNTGG